MKYSGLVLFSFLAMVFIQCSNPSSENPAATNSSSDTLNKEVLAQSMCKCAQPLIDLNKQMEVLHAEGKKDEFIALSAELSKKFKAAAACSREAKQNQKVEEEQKTALANSLLQTCPGLKDRLADQLVNQIANQ